jgi:hypothetical protein
MGVENMKRLFCAAAAGAVMSLSMAMTPALASPQGSGLAGETLRIADAGQFHLAGYRYQRRHWRNQWRRHHFGGNWRPRHCRMERECWHNKWGERECSVERVCGRRY